MGLSENKLRACIYGHALSEQLPALAEEATSILEQPDLACYKERNVKKDLGNERERMVLRKTSHGGQTKIANELQKFVSRNNNVAIIVA